MFLRSFNDVGYRPRTHPLLFPGRAPQTGANRVLAGKGLPNIPQAEDITFDDRKVIAIAQTAGVPHKCCDIETSRKTLLDNLTSDSTGGTEDNDLHVTNLRPQLQIESVQLRLAMKRTLHGIATIIICQPQSCEFTELPESTDLTNWSALPDNNKGARTDSAWASDARRRCSTNLQAVDTGWNINRHSDIAHG
jgi:hypothetical protein